MKTENFFQTFRTETYATKNVGFTEMYFSIQCIALKSLFVSIHFQILGIHSQTFFFKVHK